MRKDSTLTAADLDNIVTENFAPDIKKLAHEIGANLDNPDRVAGDRNAYYRDLWPSGNARRVKLRSDNLRGHEGDQ